jgi:hypothetical protein
MPHLPTVQNTEKCYPGNLTPSLDDLRVGTENIENNSVVFSLEPHHDEAWQVATVSFCKQSDEFVECRPGRTSSLVFPHFNSGNELGKSTITVDCDFVGMTPLYILPHLFRYE